MKLRCRDLLISLDKPVVMGVLNVTPDSFSDGGLWLDPAVAIAHGAAMVKEGAGIVDVGGESTRPGAESVDEAEELRRVIPVVGELANELTVPVSIDTRKPEVARRAVEAGARIVNDELGEAHEDAMDELVAATGAALVVMHNRGTPAEMRGLARYDDVVAEVTAFLQARAEDLQGRGVARDSIVLDPGFGFAKTPGHNLQLLRRLDEIVSLGYPVLSGTSRKSFIGAVLDVDVDRRVFGTAATVAWSLVKGARIVRVHDVAPMTQVVEMIDAISSAPGG